MSNRKATAGRAFIYQPVFKTVKTKFGDIEQKTNQFRKVSLPVVVRASKSRTMTVREKDLRRELKRRKHGKTVNFTHKATHELRVELAGITNSILA